MRDDAAIFVCDDEKVHADLIQWNLARAGITNPVVHFKSGTSLLGRLLPPRSEPGSAPGAPAILILDIRMPEMDGVEVLTEIRRHDELTAMPVVMLTTVDDPAEMAKCQQLGCNYFLTKPFYYEVLINVVRQLLSSHEPSLAG